jgi:L-fucose isomerase-like protein
MTAPRIGFVTCVHPIYDLPSALQCRDRAISGLRASGCDVIVSKSARDPQDIPEIRDELKRSDIDLLLFFFCTWVAEEITLSIARELEDTPLLLWALPYFDLSIPMPSPMTGITATGCNLQRAGRAFLHRVGSVSPEQIEAVRRAARAACVVRKLRMSRFGVFGAPCPGMLDTICDDSLLHKHLGLTVIRRDIGEVLRARDAVPLSEALERAVPLVKSTRSEVAPEVVAEQCRMLEAMKFLIREHQLDGFAVRCWPELRDQHEITICLAMAELAEEGIASSCEADLTALATSYILTSLAAQPSCTLEMTAWLEGQNALQFAHCGAAAPSLAADPNSALLRGHMRTGSGALLEFGLKPGTVTIAKMLRPFESGMKLFAGRGEVIPTDPSVRGTVATLRVEPSPAQFLDAMLRYGVEHHLVIVYGDWIKELGEFAQFAGIEVLRP